MLYDKLNFDPSGHSSVVRASELELEGREYDSHLEIPSFLVLEFFFFFQIIQLLTQSARWEDKIREQYS